MARTCCYGRRSHGEGDSSCCRRKRREGIVACGSYISSPATCKAPITETSSLAGFLNYAEEIGFEMTNIKDAIRDIEDRDILQRLSDVDSGSDHARARSSRTATTGDWIMQEDAYKGWLDGGSQVLWLHGIPGCGKTILSSTVIDHLQQMNDQKQNVRVSYFYFDASDSRKASVDACVRNILRQLSTPRVPDSVKGLYTQGESRGQPTLGSALQALSEIIDSMDRVYLVLDAVDQCDDVSFCLDILSAVKSLSKIRILMTSRPNLVIQHAVSTVAYASITLDASKVERDIRTFVADRLHNDPSLSKRWSKDRKRLIQDTVVARSAGMFQLAKCQLHEFERCYSHHDLEVALSKLPSTLTTIYDRMLCQIPPSFRVQAHTLLTWLSFSARPLLLEEAAEVLALDFCGLSPRLDPQRRLLQPRDVLSICPGLVTVSAGCTRSSSGPDGRLVAQLAHSSVREYLLLQSMPAYAIQTETAHLSIAETCLTYVLQLDGAVWSQLDKDYPLARYAAEFWPMHVRLASTTSQPRLQLMMEDLFLFRNSALLSWIRIHNHDEPWRTQKRPLDESFAAFLPSPLYFASLTGLETVVACILANEPRISEAEGLYGSALHAAAGRGWAKVVELLLDHGMELGTSGLYGNALHTAAFEGHVSVCRVLLHRGADANERGDEFGTPLEAAIYGDHSDVVALMLDAGAEISAQGRHYADCLQTACTIGNKEIIEILLKKRKVDPLGASYNRALQAAADRNSCQISDLLKKYGPSATTRNETYGSALHAAVAHGYARIVDLLLDRGADVNAVEEDHGTALCVAASTGSHELALLLLDRNARIETQGPAGTALHVASGMGHAKVVKLLLDRGARPNSRGGHFGTALQAACYKGNLDVAKMLLGADADPNVQAGEYGYALHAAVCGLSLQAETVKLLLDHGAHVEAYRQGYGTPLQVALSREDDAIARLLRRHGSLTFLPEEALHKTT
ncbi:ankyrin repeat-containing domain protein [Aspergillus heterothallicus]